MSAFTSHSFTPVGDSSALDSEVNVEIEPSLSLAIMDKDPSVSSDASAIDTMSMEVTPNASGVFISSTAYVVAGSNNETGYTLSFSDADDNTALVSTTDATQIISSISATSSSLTDITTNQWGYAFGSTGTLSSSFDPIPALSSPITLVSTTIPASNAYPFTAASKIDMNVPSGVYQDSLVFSLVANYVPPKTLSSITDMTKMTSENCAASAIGESTTMTDPRDDETYTVKKLADGKCWMTQNLRLARSKAVTLTSADSDVSSDFSLPIAPTTASSWGSYSSATDVNKTHLYNTQDDSCGVYYNWFAATAGAGLYDNTTTNATSSICPKGWRLPTGGASGDFQTLYAAENRNVTTFTNDGAWVLSGYYGYSGSVGDPGRGGGWWSSTPYPSSANIAYRLTLSSSNVSPQNYTSKANGLSVRCLAR